MKRLLMIVPIAALAVTGFVPAQAGDGEKTPIVAACFGTAGYEDGVWEASAVRIDDDPLDSGGGSGGSVLGSTCVTWSPDTAEPLGPPPALLPPPNNPDDYIWVLDRWLGPPNPAQVIFNNSAHRMHLTGEGDFACGNGTLERASGGHSILDYGNKGVISGSQWRWHLDWSATFENGVGELDGTADRHPWPTASNLQETRSLSGRIFVNDGAAYGQCDDSADASQIVAVFVLK